MCDDINNNLRSPLKVISYLACGKCVISNINCDVPQMENKGVYSITAPESFIELIERAYNDNLFYDSKSVNSFLESISYDSLLEIIFNRLIAELPGKVSLEK